MCCLLKTFLFFLVCSNTVKFCQGLCTLIDYSNVRARICASYSFDFAACLCPSSSLHDIEEAIVRLFLVFIRGLYGTISLLPLLKQLSFEEILVQTVKFALESPNVNIMNVCWLVFNYNNCCLLSSEQNLEEEYLHFLVLILVKNVQMILQLQCYLRCATCIIREVQPRLFQSLLVVTRQQTIMKFQIHSSRTK